VGEVLRQPAPDSADTIDEVIGATVKLIPAGHIDG
jgi:hypothetical protein